MMISERSVLRSQRGNRLFRRFFQAEVTGNHYSTFA